MKNKGLPPTPAFFLERRTRRANIVSDTGVHYHHRFELYYLIEGTCWYFIDKKSYHLRAGDVAMIPEGVLHRTSYETPTHTRLLLQFEPSFVPPSVREVVVAHPCFTPRGEAIERVRTLFADMERENEAPDAFSEDVIRQRVAELLLFIARASDDGAAERRGNPIVERAVYFIRQHYTEDIGLSEAAAYCFVSKEHLSRVFKRETGFGFCEFLCAYRLKKAESMLKGDRKAKIAEVAFACGFNDSNYFSKVYKRTYGQTPTGEKRAERVLDEDSYAYVSDKDGT